jgi:hypothetical protein
MLMDEQPDIERILDSEGAAYRSATSTALAAAAIAAPFVAPYFHKGIDKLTAPEDEGPQIVLPPGVNEDD